MDLLDVNAVRSLLGIRDHGLMIDDADVEHHGRAAIKRELVSMVDLKGNLRWVPHD